MSESSPYVPNVHFELIPIKNLVSNQEYQRNLSMAHIKKAADHFDPYQINPVKVSRRDGNNYVFNGQHTIEIVATVSGSRNTPVWCMVYDALDYRAEADIFANQQKYVKTLLPYEIFIANIEAGSDKQLIIKSLVESFGLQITGNARPGGICCVSALEMIYDKYKYQVLERTLRLCIAAWEGEQHSLTGNMLKGIAKMVASYGDTLKDDTFKEKVGAFSAREISRMAKDRKAGAIGFAEAMVVAYNKRVGNNSPSYLRWEMLHRTRRTLTEEPSEPMEEEIADSESISGKGAETQPVEGDETQPEGDKIQPAV